MKLIFICVAILVLFLEVIRKVESNNCFGYQSVDVQVCSNKKGTCIGKNKCDCKPTHIGRRCFYTVGTEYVEQMNVVYGPGSAVLGYTGKMAADNKGNFYFAPMNGTFVGKQTTDFEMAVYAGKKNTIGNINDRGIYARFTRITDIAIMSNNRILVADAGVGKIKVIDPTDLLVTNYIDETYPLLTDIIVDNFDRVVIQYGTCIARIDEKLKTTTHIFKPVNCNETMTTFKSMIHNPKYNYLMVVTDHKIHNIPYGAQGLTEPVSTYGDFGDAVGNAPLFTKLRSIAVDKRTGNMFLWDDSLGKIKRFTYNLGAGQLVQEKILAASTNIGTTKAQSSKGDYDMPLNSVYFTLYEVEDMLVHENSLLLGESKIDRTHRVKSHLLFNESKIEVTNSCFGHPGKITDNSLAFNEDYWVAGIDVLKHSQNDLLALKIQDTPFESTLFNASVNYKFYITFFQHGLSEKGTVRLKKENGDHFGPTHYLNQNGLNTIEFDASNTDAFRLVLKADSGCLLFITKIEMQYIVGNSTECSGHGTCVGTNQCQCFDKYTGEQCERSSICDYTNSEPFIGENLKPGMTNGATALLNGPNSIVSDANNDLFIVDTKNHAIRLSSSSGFVTTYAGQIGLPGYEDGQNQYAKFNYPTRVTMDDITRTLYVSDSGNHRIRNISVSHQVATVAHVSNVYELEFLNWEGQRRLYYSTKYQSDGRAKLAYINMNTNGEEVLSHSEKGDMPGTCTLMTISPISSMVSKKDSLYFATFSGQIGVIKKVGQSGCYMHFLTKVRNEATYIRGHLDGYIEYAVFNTIYGMDMIYDSLYVVDSSATVRRINLETKTVTTVAGVPNHEVAAVDFSSTKTTKVKSDLYFKSLSSIHINPINEDVYVSDIDTNVIHKIRFDMDPTCSCKEWKIGESTCMCENRRGIKCEFLKYSCFGYDSVEGENTCESRGNCTLPDTCSCDAKFQGNQCERSICDGSHYVDIATLSNAIYLGTSDKILVLSQSPLDQHLLRHYSHETLQHTGNDINFGSTAGDPFISIQGAVSMRDPNGMEGDIDGTIVLSHHSDSHDKIMISDNFYETSETTIKDLTHPNIGSKTQIFDNTLIYVSTNGIIFYNLGTETTTQWNLPSFLNRTTLRFSYKKNERLYISHENQIYSMETSVSSLANVTHSINTGYKDGLLSQAKFNQIIDIEYDPLHENGLYVLETYTTNEVRLRHIRLGGIATTIISNLTAYWQAYPIQMKMSVYDDKPRLYFLYSGDGTVLNMKVGAWKIENNPICHCANWTVFSNCTCIDGYKGNMCDQEKVKCYGVVETESGVCSGHGVCESINQCKCESGWGDYNCHIPMCNGFLATDINVCNKKGSCVNAEVCSCESGYQTTQYCEPCPLGQYQNGTGFGTATCLKCPLGYYSNTPAANNSAVCKPCEINTYADSPGLAICIPCPSGSFHPPNTTAEKDDTNCVSCPAGKYSVGNGDGCQDCIPGTYSTSLGATSSAVCIQCGQGTYSDVSGANNPGTCTQCPGGTYSTALGASLLTHCTKCPPGTYSDSGSGQISPSVCKKCPAGTASDAEGATSLSTCTTCPIGTFSPIASDRCIPCTQGTYNENTGVANCTVCPSGSTTPPPTATQGSISSTECQTCEAGYFTSQSGIGCVPCPLGTASSLFPAPDPTACVDCQIGTFANQPGSTECEVCKAGYYTPDIRTCLPCPGGYYTPNDKMLACQPCPTGYYSEPGSSVCTACPKGTYSTTPTASSSDVCKPCESGWVSTPASTECTICEKGHYADSDQQFCVACVAGTFAPNNASANYTYCIECPKGTYSGVVGAYDLAQCELCPKGRFNEFPKQTDIDSCKYCPTGTASNTTGAPSVENCKLCLPTTYADGEGMSSCLECKTGICPYYGASGVMQPLENGDTPYSVDNNHIFNPQVAESGISVASLVSKYTPVLILVIIGGITFIVLMVLSMCIYGKGNPCLAVQKADIFFTMKHRLNENEARTKKKTCLGGFFSVIAIITILVLICVSTSDLFFNNIYVSESFTTPKGRTFVNKGDFVGHAYYFGKFDSKCNSSHISVSQSGFILSDDEEVTVREEFTCAQSTTYNGTEDVDTCHCKWTCFQCTLDGVKQNVEFKAPGIMTSVIGYDFRVPHFIEEAHYILNGSIQAGGSSLFYGSKSTTLFINLFNTIYTAQPGIMAPAVSLFPFFQTAAQNELNGLQSQLQSVSTGDRLSGSSPSSYSYSDNFQGVTVSYQMEISSFVFLLEEQLRQSTLNFFAQISALSSMVLAIVTVLLGVTEALISNIRLIKERRVKMSRKRKEKKSTTKPDWLKEEEYKQDEYIKCPPTPSANSLTNELTDEAPGEGGGGFDSMPPFMANSTFPNSTNTPQTPQPFLDSPSNQNSSKSTLPPFMM